VDSFRLIEDGMHSTVTRQIGRRLALVALTTVIATLGASSGAFAATGKIVVTLKPPEGASTTGFDSVCAVNRARAEKYGVNERSIVGKCGRVSHDNVAVLKRVPKGRWGIAGVGGVGSNFYPKRVRVRKGHTTHVKWKVPMWG
jgi:hypothetical protein